MKLSYIFPLIVSAGLMLANGCAQPDDVVNVYSGRHYQADENLFRDFTNQTGIRVNLVKANLDQLLNRLEMEGKDRQPTSLSQQPRDDSLMPKRKDCCSRLSQKKPRVPGKENGKVQFLNGNEPEYIGYAGGRHIFKVVQGKYSLISEIY